MDIIVRAYWKKKKIDEIPIVFVDRIFGASKLGLGEIKKFLQGIWVLMQVKHEWDNKLMLSDMKNIMHKLCKFNQFKIKPNYW